jgi:enoyl-CoA hydratase/carnithine racemase
MFLQTKNFTKLLKLSKNDYATSWIINENTFGNKKVLLVEMKTNKLNLIDYTFISDLNNTLELLETETDPTLPLVLTGSNFAFSAGFDMKLLKEMKKQEMREFLTLFHNAVEKLYSIPRPTTAAIKGHGNFQIQHLTQLSNRWRSYNCSSL